MNMSPPMRKFALAAHVTTSVGWIGAVLAFLALALGGLLGTDDQLVRSAYITMAWIAWFVIVPLALASFATGVVSSLGTGWGLLRHYWVLIKLLITVGATAVLIVYMQPINLLAAAATSGSLLPEHRDPRVLMVVASAAALIALLLLMALSIYKPKGMTKYGWQKHQPTQVA